jgi:C1A family cysteine protease
MKTKKKTKKRKFSFGWVPDVPDHRDFMYSAPQKVVAKLPPSVDLRPKCPPVYDQGQLGSCTANAIGGAIEYEQIKQKKKKVFVPSRLFIYYNERVIENTVNSDSGAMIRDGMKTVNKDGAPPESIWKYDITKFTVKPPKASFKEALKNQVLQYSRLVQTLNQLKGCLADGYPFVFGFSVYESFYNIDSSGVMPLPKAGEKLEGGHAVMAAGYDDTKQLFTIRNSWGDSWGKKGYFYMPYAYITDSNNADDIWTVRLVE